MKVAAIDLGSNSIHMVIAEVGASGGFQVIDREAEMVRLGAGALKTGVLSDEAMDRTLAILRAYRRLARIHKVEEVVAFATSAIREARNGEDLLDRIGRKTGIWPKAIPGEEEGRLVYLAALHSVHTMGKRTLVVDIGGGSVEIVVGKGTNVEVAASLKLGAIRMTEEFVGSDPVAAKEERRLVAHVRAALEPVAKRIARHRVERAVGTSGTILALGRMAIAAETGARPETLHHVTVGADALHEVRRRVTAVELKRRLKLPAIDRRRADLLPAGAIVLDTILSTLGVRELTLCEWALREGILVDFVAKRRTTLARAEAYPDVRRRSVLELAERWRYDEGHARHVTRLALELFDATRGTHRMDDDDRTLLEYASLLHDCGEHISRGQHHKHSYYLIQNADLRGFDPTEIRIMANVARYHRGARPGKRHTGFAGLGAADRKRVVVLAAVLRLAESLDRTHRQHIRAVVRVRSSKGVRIECRSVGDVELEVWGARRNVETLSDALRGPVQLEFRPDRRDQPASRAAARG